MTTRRASHADSWFVFHWFWKRPIIRYSGDARALDKELGDWLRPIPLQVNHLDLYMLQKYPAGALISLYIWLPIEEFSSYCCEKPIWVSFPRTGKMSVLRYFFFKSIRLVWLNQTILTTSVDLWWLIMTFWFWKSWIWPLLSKKTLFTAPSTWPIRRFLVIFEVRIKPSCDHTFTAGPNLMCPSS